MGKEMPHEERMSILMQMHEDMLGYCTRKYKVDSQILLHIHAFWEYQESQLERKTWKKIMQSNFWSFMCISSYLIDCFCFNVCILRLQTCN